ncbi:MAG: IS21 family transposase [Caldilineales bacterium]|nr:IS21 family transposase [Caldilineales bacterium]
MITVKDRERIRIAYFREHKSIRAIARELHYSPKTIKKALASAEVETYTQSQARAAPVLGPYKQVIEELLAANEKLPGKQRYTSHKIYEAIRELGYEGGESTVRGYVAQKRKEKRRPKVYVPLEFDPGRDAQVDWAEAWVEIAGELVKVQLFFMRLNYSRRVFVKAYPAQNQVAFFDGHVCAFHHFLGVPLRLTYDNLKAAVQKVLEGRNRQEQDQFVAFRSHYLFESHFCTPGQAHEKGGVEHVVGFIRRNFLVPIPQVDSWEALNVLLLAACLADDQRQVQGQTLAIAAGWEQERPFLRPLPGRDFPCCTTKPVTLQPYSQVVFESNRYSVPADRVQKKLVVRAYALRIDILDANEILASHARCYDQGQEILDPLHYLPLLAQRPGAFDHAKPIRRWRQQWPSVYEHLLAHLQAVEEEGAAVRHFVQVLALHKEYPAAEIEQAVQQALAYGCAHVDGVKLCLHHLRHPAVSPPALDLSAQPHLLHIAAQPVDLHRYEQLLTEVTS